MDSFYVSCLFTFHVSCLFTFNVSCLFTLMSAVCLHFIFLFLDSIQQLCQLSWYCGESVGQVQQRNNGCTPSKACLETVNKNFKAPEANWQVKGNPAHYQRIVLQFTANEVNKIPTCIGTFFESLLNFEKMGLDKS